MVTATASNHNGKKIITVVHCWSAPRSRSTAVLYSFEARGKDDCVAIDEPLYRGWLIEKGDSVARPYREELIHGKPPPPADNEDDKKSEEEKEEEEKIWKRELKSLEERIQDGAKLLKSNNPNDMGVIFCKHMAKHCFLYNFERECSIVSHHDHQAAIIAKQEEEEGIVLIHKHVLLIRDPVAVLSSWDNSSGVHGSTATPDEVGIVPLLSIYSTLQSRTKSFSSSSLVVLDSDELVADPKTTFQVVCEQLSIPFKESMLSWKRGSHECDGPWARWWYANVHKSDGWALETKEYYPGSENSKYRILNTDLLLALKASLPAYEFLLKLTPRHRNRGYVASRRQNGYHKNGIHQEDPRNTKVLLYIGSSPKSCGGFGRLLPRDMAGISPWDASMLMQQQPGVGLGVDDSNLCWEGIYITEDGQLWMFEQHICHLLQSAKALGFQNIHTKEEIMEAIFRTLAANNMRDYGGYIRVTLTRGEKSSSIVSSSKEYGTTLIILPEWIPKGCPSLDNSEEITTTYNTNSAMNLFLVDNGVLCTTPPPPPSSSSLPHSDDNDGENKNNDNSMKNLAKQTVLELADELHIPTERRNISFEEFQSAKEVFKISTTVTPNLSAFITPVAVLMDDDKNMGIITTTTTTASPPDNSSIAKRLQEAYVTLPKRAEWVTPIPKFV